MNVSSSMSGYIAQANVELERVSHEMASGEKQTLSPAEYQKQLVLDDDIAMYKTINRDLSLSKVENDVADKVMSEIKDIISSSSSKMILANNATTTDTDRDIIAGELRSYKDAIIDMANTEVMDNSLFAGSDKSVKAFSYEKDIDGHYTDVTYNGTANKFQQDIGKGTTTGQGLTGLELFDGLVDSSGKLIYDSKGQKIESIAEDGEIIFALNPNGSTVMFDASTQEAGLQPKIIYELDRAIDAVDNNRTTDDLTKTPPEYSIGSATERVSEEVFEKLNVQHSKLGNSNAMFERAFDQNEYKLFSLDKVLQETVGIDIAEASIKLQQLELMFASIFSTLQKVNEIEQQLAQSM